MMNRLYCVLTVLAMACSVCDAQAGPFEYEFEELRPGVWVGVRPDGPRPPVMGTSTFVIGEDGVVVFDGGGMPVMAEQLIDKIRSLTKVPVTHVAISHWHGDHVFGIYRFAGEYPNVQFVAHRFTHAALNGSPAQYIKRFPDFKKNRVPQFEEALRTGLLEDGTALPAAYRGAYKRIIEDVDEIDAEYQRARITSPNLVFEDKLIVHSGGRRIELLHLGHGNTAGDIVMWLPDEKIVAAGDLVVLPTPYAFNVPPRAWAETLTKLNELGYDILVPGHGDVQRDTEYVDLLIETAVAIADQRDRLLSEGLSKEEVEQRLDFSAFEERFTGGDEYVTGYYKAYFEEPFREAAIKALSGEPMVKIEPVSE